MIRRVNRFFRRWSEIVIILGLAVIIAIDFSRMIPERLVMSSNSTPIIHLRYAVNADHQTYGSVNGGTSFFDPPILVKVEDTAGQVGYAYARQLYGSMPTTLPTAQQAVTQDATMSQGYIIPVYESNGTTVIGQFQVGGASPLLIAAHTHNN